MNRREPTIEDLERFARDYTLVTQSKMRGGMRTPGIKQIRADLKESFPGISWLVLVYWAFKIWMLLRS